MKFISTMQLTSSNFHKINSLFAMLFFNCLYICCLQLVAALGCSEVGVGEQGQDLFFFFFFFFFLGGGGKNTSFLGEKKLKTKNKVFIFQADKQNTHTHTHKQTKQNKSHSDGGRGQVSPWIIITPNVVWHITFWGLLHFSLYRRKLR